MRDCVPALEQQFFARFADYLDLEKNTSRKYSAREYSLAHMDRLAELAGNPEKHLKIIHVAGTKGKGSTCLYLGALLASAGSSCGVFTSPHLATVRERFLINGSLVSYPTLLAAAEKTEGAVRQAGLKPTFFEIMTVLALRLFADAGCEYAVMETGIGGLLDSTNYVRSPVCCVITSISLDHMQLLGNTIAEIAEQKAGIIKPGVPVVVSRQPFPAAAEIVERRAGELHAPVFRPVAPSPSFQAILNPLPDFARDDFRNALTVMQVLGLAPDATAYQAPLLRGRFECVRTNPLVILDVAHNADSAQRLVEALREFYPATTFCVVLGIVKGKDVPGIFHALLPVAAEFILTNPRTDKGSELPQLHALATASGKPFRVIPEITDAADLPSCKPLLFTGSFFTALIGEMLYL